MPSSKIATIIEKKESKIVIGGLLLVCIIGGIYYYSRKGEPKFKIIPYKKAMDKRDKTISELLELSDESIQSLDKEKAVEYSRQLKDKGNEYFRAKQLDESIQSYSQAIKLLELSDLPLDAIYYCNRAAAYLLLNQFDEANRDCTLAVQLDSYYVKAWIRKGTCNEKLGDVSVATRDYAMAYFCSNFSNELAYNSYEECIRKSSTEFAENFTLNNEKCASMSAINNFIHSLSKDDIMSEIINDGSFSANLKWYFGWFYEIKNAEELNLIDERLIDLLKDPNNQIDTLIPDFKDKLELYDETKNEYRYESKLYQLKAMCDQLFKNTKESKDNLLRSLLLDHRNIQARVLLANNVLEQMVIEKSQKHVESQENPSPTIGHNDTEMSIKLLESVLELDPNHNGAHYLLGQIYMIINDNQNAYKNYRKCISNSTNKDGELNAPGFYAQLRIVSVVARLKGFEDGIKEFDILVKDYQHNPFKLSEVCLAYGDYYLQEFQRLCSTNQINQYEAGSYIKHAETWLLKGVDLNDKNCALLSSLGSLYAYYLPIVAGKSDEDSEKAYRFSVQAHQADIRDEQALNLLCQIAFKMKKPECLEYFDQLTATARDKGDYKKLLALKLNARMVLELVKKFTNKEDLIFRNFA